MNINKLGIKFSYYGDEITWIWPWKRKEFEGNRLLSGYFPSGFKNIKDYWVSMGAFRETVVKSKVIGMSIEVIRDDWIRNTFPYSNLVAIVNPNMSFLIKKTPGLLSKISNRTEFNKDVTILFCLTPDEAINICKDIPKRVGKAYAWSNGVIIHGNTNKKK